LVLGITSCHVLEKSFTPSCDGITPYQAYTGKKPDLRHLRIFGSRVVSRLPGRRPAKLDSHTAGGVFLGFTETNRNIYYRDNESRRIKIATHVTFDEAGYTVPHSQLTPIQRTLQCCGHEQVEKVAGEPLLEPLDSTTLQVMLLSDHATLPTRGTPDSAGLDLYSAITLELPPGKPTAIPTDIAVCPPPGTYCQILSRSRLMLNHHVEAKAGVIDRDYIGNVKVILVNHTNSPYRVEKGAKIAQMVVYHIIQSKPTLATSLQHTQRGSGGFGSTDEPQSCTSGTSTKGSTHDQPGAGGTLHGTPQGVEPADDIQLDTNCQVPIATVHQVQQIADHILQVDGIAPYNIWMSTDPFNHRMTLNIDTKGTHPTMGLIVKECPTTHRVQLIDMAPGTPGIRIPKWRSTIKRSILLSINNIAIQHPDDVPRVIAEIRAQGATMGVFEFATATGLIHHPTEESLHLYYDQLNVIAEHLQQYHHMATTTTDKAVIHTATGPSPPDKELGQMFTWWQIKQRSDLSEWKSKRYKMLNDYHQQGMFGAPMKKLPKANVHHMLWRYAIKQDGTKKARMVCDRSPRQGTITLGHTYANSLMAASERMFWALTAMNNLVAYGADATNAFAEAPPPVHPLYLYIDDAFKEWWTDHLGYPPIPPDHKVVQVRNAIQGHPESPRLWEKHIDRILRELGFKPTRHEPCLYRATIDGKMVLFLRQVDDFAIAATNATTVDRLIDQINEQLRMPMKNLGIITRFNGIDIEQTRDYVKLHCQKYLTTMLQKHGWLQPLPPLSNNPVPFHTDRNTMRQLQEAPTPDTDEQRKVLQKEMGFSYRQLMGEIMYPMVKCRPDISPHSIFLSQFMDNPGQSHYQALKEVALYLAHTIRDGIHYWRSEPNGKLPAAALPTPHQDNYTLQETRGSNSLNLIGYVDSDWAANIKKRTSLTGAIVMLAGGAIGYKTKFQMVIAHSSTEAEFVAACDTAKIILFFRSIMEELGLPQEDATILFEDNTGALMMANAQQPTKRTRHIDIKHFALLDWVEQDLLQLHQIGTHDNAVQMP
jgi:deoxyuridine 5'-triphosphate nucleotidohydrolase